MHEARKSIPSEVEELMQEFQNWTGWEIQMNWNPQQNPDGVLLLDMLSPSADCDSPVFTTGGCHGRHILQKSFQHTGCGSHCSPITTCGVGCVQSVVHFTAVKSHSSTS
jgi:hypothetical protein